MILNLILKSSNIHIIFSRIMKIHLKSIFLMLSNINLKSELVIDDLIS